MPNAFRAASECSFVHDLQRPAPVPPRNCPVPFYLSTLYERDAKNFICLNRYPRSPSARWQRVSATRSFCPRPILARVQTRTQRYTRERYARLYVDGRRPTAEVSSMFHRVHALLSVTKTEPPVGGNA